MPVDWSPKPSRDASRLRFRVRGAAEAESTAAICDRAPARSSMRALNVPRVYACPYAAASMILAKSPPRKGVLSLIGPSNARLAWDSLVNGFRSIVVGGRRMPMMKVSSGCLASGFAMDKRSPASEIKIPRCGEGP
eukprot:scaffold30163_cov124-Isochrysis_galbana.AAC.8